MRIKTILYALLALSLSVSTVYAAPSVKRSGSTITVKEALNDDVITQIKQEMGNLKTPVFQLQDIKDEDLVKFCQTFPDIRDLRVSAKKNELTSIAPVAELKNLNAITLRAESVKDMSPLAALTKLNKVAISSKSMGPDLKWMAGLNALKFVEINAGPDLISFEGLPALPAQASLLLNGAAPATLAPVQAQPVAKLSLKYCAIADLSPLAAMPNLTELDLYGAQVKDFSPLAQCPKLKKITYYAVKDANFSTLGALKQVTELNGGLTKLDSIAFVADLPALRVFDVFAEYVTDYAPLAASKVEKFQIWQMRKPVGDLGVVGKAVNLKELKLWSVDGATNSAGLAGLTNLVKFTIASDYNKKSGEPFDLACAKGWSKLEDMALNNTKVVNAANIAALTSLKKLSLVKINVGGEPLSLAGIGKLGNLRSLQLTDSNVADFKALAGCAELAYLDIRGCKGIDSLASIKALPKLQKVTLSKDVFPESELSGFADGVKVDLR